MNRARMYLSVFVLQFILLLCSTAGLSLENSPFVEEQTTRDHLGCHRRLYTYKVIQVDSEGRECWDHVSVLSCRGRCASSEMSDWKFPFSVTLHPVCVHASRSKSVTMLRNCHPDVDPETRRYEYLEAVACHCHTCSLSDTACLSPNRDKAAVKKLAMAERNLNDLVY